MQIFERENKLENMDSRADALHESVSQIFLHKNYILGSDVQKNSPESQPPFLFTRIQVDVDLGSFRNPFNSHSNRVYLPLLSQ